jgi:TonB family protein
LHTADGGTPDPEAAPPARLVRSDELDAGFRLVAPVRPSYPVRARRLARPGLVELEVEVAPDGRVARIEVLAESRGWGFGAEARRAFAAARFTPPTVAGRPVRVLWRRTLHFRP